MNIPSFPGRPARRGNIRLCPLTVVFSQNIFQFFTQNYFASSHYTRQLLQALGYMHSCGVVHRDIRPHNVLLARYDSVISPAFWPEFFPILQLSTAELKTLACPTKQKSRLPIDINKKCHKKPSSLNLFHSSVQFFSTLCIQWPNLCRCPHENKKNTAIIGLKRIAIMNRETKTNFFSVKITQRLWN